jgi:hypothetical protein
MSTVDTVAIPGTCGGFAVASARSTADIVLAINHPGHDDTPARESVGPLRTLTGAYYRVTGTSPFIELVVRKP